MDETNSNAEKAIGGAISYAVKNNIWKVATMETVKVAEEEVFETIDKGFLFYQLKTN